MTIVEALVQYLKADAAVAAVVAGRVYPNRAQQDAARPYIVVSRESEKDDNSLSGACGTPTVKVRATCWGGTWGGGYTTGRALADKVEAATGGQGGPQLRSFRGTMATSPGVFVFCCRVEDDADSDQPPQDGTGKGEQSVPVKLSVSYVKQ